MTAKVGAGVVGRVSEVFVERGEMVQVGQILAVLDVDVQKAALDLAAERARNKFPVERLLARLAYLRRVMGRFEKLGVARWMAEKTVDEARTNTAIAAIELNEAKVAERLANLEEIRARAVLNQRTVRSAISGVVVEKKLSAGEYQHENSYILTIAQLDPLNIEVFLPVSYYGQLRLGLVGLIRPESPIGGEYKAKVSIVDKVIDASSGTFGVRLELSNPGCRLPAGLRCKAGFFSFESVSIGGSR